MPADLTPLYNTPLSPEDEAKFQAWIKSSGRERDLADYDLRGAWKADAKEAANGHLPDTWKKPNHPTFSTESLYNGKDGHQGGEWTEVKGRWRFRASPGNVANMGGAGQLEQYFRQREPDSRLELPPLPKEPVVYPRSGSGAM
jgi:hypothetical protein